MNAREPEQWPPDESVTDVNFLDRCAETTVRHQEYHEGLVQCPLCGFWVERLFGAGADRIGVPFTCPFGDFVVWFDQDGEGNIEATVAESCESDLDTECPETDGGVGFSGLSWHRVR